MKIQLNFIKKSRSSQSDKNKIKNEQIVKKLSEEIKEYNRKQNVESYEGLLGENIEELSKN